MEYFENILFIVFSVILIIILYWLDNIYKFGYNFKSIIMAVIIFAILTYLQIFNSDVLKIEAFKPNTANTDKNYRNEVYKINYINPYITNFESIDFNFRKNYNNGNFKTYIFNKINELLISKYINILNTLSYKSPFIIPSRNTLTTPKFKLEHLDRITDVSNNTNTKCTLINDNISNYFIFDTPTPRKDITPKTIKDTGLLILMSGYIIKFNITDDLKDNIIYIFEKTDLGYNKKNKINIFYNPTNPTKTTDPTEIYIDTNIDPNIKYVAIIQNKTEYHKNLTAGETNIPVILIDKTNININKPIFYRNITNDTQRNKYRKWLLDSYNKIIDIHFKDEIYNISANYMDAKLEKINEIYTKELQAMFSVKNNRDPANTPQEIDGTKKTKYDPYEIIIRNTKTIPYMKIKYAALSRSAKTFKIYLDRTNLGDLSGAVMINYDNFNNNNKIPIEVKLDKNEYINELNLLLKNNYFIEKNIKEHIKKQIEYYKSDNKLNDIFITESFINTNYLYEYKLKMQMLVSEILKRNYKTNLKNIVTYRFNFGNKLIKINKNNLTYNNNNLILNNNIINKYNINKYYKNISDLRRDMRALLINLYKNIWYLKEYNLDEYKQNTNISDYFIKISKKYYCFNINKFKQTNLNIEDNILKIINNSPFSNKKSDSSTPPIYIDYFVKHKLNVSGIKFSNYSKFNYDKYKSNNKKTINIQKNDYIYNNPTLQNDIFNCTEIKDIDYITSINSSSNIYSIINTGLKLCFVSSSKIHKDLNRNFIKYKQQIKSDTVFIKIASKISDLTTSYIKYNHNDICKNIINKHNENNIFPIIHNDTDNNILELPSDIIIDYDYNEYNTIKKKSSGIIYEYTSSTVNTRQDFIEKLLGNGIESIIPIPNSTKIKIKIITNDLTTFLKDIDYIKNTNNIYEKYVKLIYNDNDGNNKYNICKILNICNDYSYQTYLINNKYIELDTFYPNDSNIKYTNIYIYKRNNNIHYISDTDSVNEYKITNNIIEPIDNINTIFDNYLFETKQQNINKYIWNINDLYKDNNIIKFTKDKFKNKNTNEINTIMTKLIDNIIFNDVLQIHYDIPINIGIKKDGDASTPKYTYSMDNIINNISIPYYKRNEIIDNIIINTEFNICNDYSQKNNIINIKINDQYICNPLISTYEQYYYYYYYIFLNILDLYDDINKECNKFIKLGKSILINQNKTNNFEITKLNKKDKSYIKIPYNLNKYLTFSNSFKLYFRKSKYIFDEIDNKTLNINKELLGSPILINNQYFDHTYLNKTMTNKQNTKRLKLYLQKFIKQYNIGTEGYNQHTIDNICNRIYTIYDTTCNTPYYKDIYPKLDESGKPINDLNISTDLSDNRKPTICNKSYCNENEITTNAYEVKNYNDNIKRDKCFKTVFDKSPGNNFINKKLITGSQYTVTPHKVANLYDIKAHLNSDPSLYSNGYGFIKNDDNTKNYLINAQKKKNKKLGTISFMDPTKTHLVKNKHLFCYGRKPPQKNQDSSYDYDINKFNEQLVIQNIKDIKKYENFEYYNIPEENYSYWR